MTHEHVLVFRKPRKGKQLGRQGPGR
jgi:hypothetical protein